MAVSPSVGEWLNKPWYVPVNTIQQWKGHVAKHGDFTAALRNYTELGKKKKPVLEGCIHVILFM